MNARRCSRIGCLRTTLDPSGKCHDHVRSRAKAPTVPATSLPAPALPKVTAPAKTTDLSGYGTEYELTHGGSTLVLRDGPTSPGVNRRGVDPAGKVVRSGPVVRIQWHTLGKNHRTDGPAVVQVKDRTLTERYYLHGKFGRTDGGPTEVTRDSSGAVTSQRWARSQGGSHREDGPAIVEHRNGALIREEWHRTGDLSRLDGPAVRIYDDEGKPAGEAFYFAGRSYSNIEKVYEAASALPPTEFRKHLFGTALEEPAVGREAEVIEIFRQGIRTFDGVREVLDGAPVEWIRAWEEGLDENEE